MSLFEILGSTSRLKILRALAARPRYVSELAELVGMDGKTAVHHLKVLEDAELVESYRVGQRKYFRLIKSLELRAAPEDKTFVLHAEESDSGGIMNSPSD